MLSYIGTRFFSSSEKAVVNHTVIILTLEYFLVTGPTLLNITAVIHDFKIENIINLHL